MKRLIDFIISVLHMLTGILALSVLLNAWIPPKVFPYANFLSLLFPFFAVAYALLCLYWLIFWKKRALIFFFIGLFLLPNTLRWIQYHEAKEDTNGLKVLSYNVHNPGVPEIPALQDFLSKEMPDIVFCQECYSLTQKKPEYLNSFYRLESDFIITYSRYPIRKSGRIFSMDNGNATFIDAETPKGVYRFINVYLHPFSLTESELTPARSSRKNLQQARILFSKLKPVFKIHQTQAQAIEKCIEESPYPVVVAGDFNAVPGSYEYYTMTKSLNDAFVESGNGFAGTYHGVRIPIKIDYIFTSSKIKAENFHIHKEIKISDHYPVTATLQFR